MEGTQRYAWSDLECSVALQPLRGRVGMPLQKAWLASTYGTVLLKIGLECSGFSVSLQKICNTAFAIANRAQSLPPDWRCTSTNRSSKLQS